MDIIFFLSLWASYGTHLSWTPLKEAIYNKTWEFRMDIKETHVTMLLEYAQNIGTFWEGL